MNKIYYDIIYVESKMLFNTKNVTHYVIAFGLIIGATSLLNNVKQNFDTNDEDYKLIKDYLLNESPLYGSNRPKMWIHSRYEINARNWKDFSSRNTDNLNQPYLHLTIKSIINHCGNDFNICLIDDESFNKLLPSWDVNVRNMAEPMKSQYRELGMARLLQVYGGIVVPNSFLCIKSLKPLYEKYNNNGKAFVCETVNHTCDLKNNTTNKDFMPNTYFMGASQNHNSIIEIVDYLQKSLSHTHITMRSNFVGVMQYKCQQLIQDDKLELVDGKVIGIKTAKNNIIILDELMEEAYLDLDNSVLGIYIPREEIIMRTKFNWFAALPIEDVLNSKMIISKYITTSLVDSMQNVEKIEHTIVTI